LLSLLNADAERARDHSRMGAARRTRDAVRAPEMEILDVGGTLTEDPRHVHAVLPRRLASAWLKPAGAPPHRSICNQTAWAMLEVPASSARELPLVASGSSPRIRANGIRKPILQVTGADR
jgi:hypothetical protein